MRRRGRDSGQAFPVYIAVVAGLLFLAFAYFLVAQAASTRSDAQTAADAAALAAAQDARGRLREGWLEVILDPGQWRGFLNGEADVGPSPCEQAAVFAARNMARLSSDGCVSLGSERRGFSVTVRTMDQKPRDATASAEAVIEPLCTFTEPEPTLDPEPPPTETADPEEGKGAILGLACDGAAWEIDPENPTLPDAADLFAVRLSK
ncbi:MULTISPECIES: pilus assembly protein TadG-related protein [unclassified Streptomyces]|uniref:pilus assembly protein TadG-related protein n=1 Tax=unclassified Streptomyces TaxID=2593676 RepID=UPI00099E2554|nr:MULTISPECIES: pilus assembly protein TadG-related protein [unclassified Streptomyces]